jgi:hypothetical protein
LWSGIESLAAEDITRIDLRTGGEGIVMLGGMLERLRAERRLEAEFARRTAASCDRSPGSAA